MDGVLFTERRGTLEEPEVTGFRVEGGVLF